METCYHFLLFLTITVPTIRQIQVFHSFSWHQQLHCHSAQFLCICVVSFRDKKSTCMLLRIKLDLMTHNFNTNQPDWTWLNFTTTTTTTTTAAIRPPDIHVGGLMFYHGFFFLSFFLPLLLSFFHRLISELAERNSIKSAVCLEVSAIWKSMSKIWGIPSPYKLGAQKPLFGQLRNLTAMFTAYIFGVKHDIDNWANALTITRGLLRRLQTTWTLVHKQLRTGPSFLPLHSISLAGFADGDQQTEPNHTLPNSGR